MRFLGWFRRSPRRPVIVTRTPYATPVAVWPAVLLALALVAAAVVAVRDLLVELGVLAGTSWTGAAVEAADGLDLTTVPLWAAAVAVVLGALLLVAALRNAAPTHRRARSGLDLWFTPEALARLAEETVDRTEGVVATRATPRRRGRRIVVAVDARADRSEVRRRARAGLDAAGVEGLVPSTTIKLKVSEVGR